MGHGIFRPGCESRARADLNRVGADPVGVGMGRVPRLWLRAGEGLRPIAPVSWSLRKPRPSVPLEAELLLVELEVTGVGLDGVDHVLGIARPMISTAPSPTMPDRRLPEIICSSFICARGISQLPSVVLTEVFGKPAGPPNDRPLHSTRQGPKTQARALTDRERGHPQGQAVLHAKLRNPPAEIRLLVPRRISPHMIALGLLADPLIRYWRVISANPERGGMIP